MAVMAEPKSAESREEPITQGMAGDAAGDAEGEKAGGEGEAQAAAEEGGWGFGRRVIGVRNDAVRNLLFGSTRQGF